MTFAELNDVSATWLRGFFPMPEADRGSPRDHPSIQTILTARDHGYGTVLSLKFPYFEKHVPTPGSPAMDTELRRLDAVLELALNEVDILVIGNEPFIESLEEDHDGRLNVFYETLAQHVIARRDERFGPLSKTRLYMGSLNHLERPGWRTPSTERWMTFVRDTPAIDGVDIHPHLPAPGDDQHYLDYVLPRMRPEQKFLATEFSMVLFWKKHLDDRVSAEFAERYGTRPTTPIWKVIRNALDEPFTQQKWDDFLLSCPWFESNKNYMRDQMERFRGTGRLAVATYGVGQDAAMTETFGRDSTPWLLNSLFCPYTVRSDGQAVPGRNTTWTDQFRALQNT